METTSFFSETLKLLGLADDDFDLSAMVYKPAAAFANALRMVELVRLKLQVPTPKAGPRPPGVSNEGPTPCACKLSLKLWPATRSLSTTVNGLAAVAAPADSRCTLR